MTPFLVEFAPLGLAAAAKADETVLDVARRAGAPIGNSCGAVGVCARCRITVLEGAEALSPPTEIERRIAAQRGVPAEERFACQAVVRGNCRVTTGYWGRE
ncbi:MAG TPA: 2Fe-2S iron-sulfur cluster-binding protein [Thermoanaerobaculia bacterium]|nr:2Fe-2S iron-sulfur cluster-binding protein [Thermoanaerobaculia bacterium]